MPESNAPGQRRPPGGGQEAGAAKKKVARRKTASSPRDDLPPGDFLNSNIFVGAGLVFGALTLVFLMWLVLGIDQIQCQKAALVALVFGLGTALSTSFIGGYAAAKGPVALPFLGNRPINVALGGGILALLLATGAAWLAVAKNCTETEGPCGATAQGETRISCGKVYKLIPPPAGEGFLVVRTGPTTSCGKRQGDDLHNDDEVIVKASENKWLYIKRYAPPPVVEGWSHGDYISEIACPANAPHQ